MGIIANSGGGVSPGTRLVIGISDAARCGIVKAADSVGTNDLARSGAAMGDWGWLVDITATSRGGASPCMRLVAPAGNGTLADGSSAVGTGLAALEG